MMARGYAAQATQVGTLGATLKRAAAIGWLHVVQMP